MKISTCGICLRQMPHTKHHLIPRQLRKRKQLVKHAHMLSNDSKRWYNRGRSDNPTFAVTEEVTPEPPPKTIGLCPDCHRMVHATYDQKVLAKQYFTIELLRSAPELQEWIKWISRQPVTAYFGSITRRGL
jgi:hypothetical protein